jgi:probable HAF family extracellular repeat protein
VGLGDLDGGTFGSIALGVSADGAVVVGQGSSASGDEAFRWTAGGMVGLGDLDGGTFGSEARAASADGSVIVGWGTSASGSEAFRWTSGSGMVGLGDLPGGVFRSGANAVSTDGIVVVGSSRTDLGDEAFIWDSHNGMRHLASVLIDVFGLDLAGWTLTQATDIAIDGGVVSIVGWGSSDNGKEAWLARYPVVAADFNKDSDVDQDDFDAFETCTTGPAICYDAANLPPGCPLIPDEQGIIAADFDRDGDVDGSDFGPFQRCLSGQDKPADPHCAD